MTLKKVFFWSLIKQCGNYSLYVPHWRNQPLVTALELNSLTFEKVKSRVFDDEKKREGITLDNCNFKAEGNNTIFNTKTKYVSNKSNSVSFRQFNYKSYCYVKYGHRCGRWCLKRPLICTKLNFGF